MKPGAQSPFSEQPDRQASPLAGLLADATAALARFDAEHLERLGERALELQALRALDGITAAEASARLRVFASVLQSTRSGLDVLRRVSASHSTDHAVAHSSRPYRDEWAPPESSPVSPLVAKNAMNGVRV